MALIEKRIAEKMLQQVRQFVAELGNQIGVLKSVVYVSEAYTGDCEQPFLLANSSDFGGLLQRRSCMPPAWLPCMATSSQQTWCMLVPDGKLHAS